MAGTIDTIFSYIETIQTILLYGWPFILLLILFIFKFKWKKWSIDAVIIEKRGENLVKTNDRACKYVDPYTKMVGTRLLKTKDEVPTINYDWVLVNVPIHTTILDRLVNLLRPTVGTLFLFKYGSKQYKPVLIKQNNERKWEWQLIRDKYNQPILRQVYEQYDPRHQIGALEFEVIDWDNMNFMVQEQRASFERRQKKSEFWKQLVIPIAMMVVAALVIIVMFKFSYDWSMGMANQYKTDAKPVDAPAKAPGNPILGNLLP